MSASRLTLVIPTCLALLGCELTEPRWDLRRGEIELGASDSLHLETPAVVTAGEPATIAVRTYGGGCVRHGEVTLVNVSGMTATIEPYDSVVVEAPDNYACLAILRMFTHNADVTFPQPGDATLRIVGMVGGAVVTRERQLAVQ